MEGTVEVKICYLSSVNSPHTIKWCKFFSEKQHEIHLITFDQGEIENVNVHYIDLKITSQSSRIKKLAFLFSFKKVKKIIKEINPDIIHAHRTTGYAFVSALSNFHPYILSVWGSDVYDLPKNPIYKKFVQFNLKKSDYIFSTSKAMKGRVNELIKKEVIVTPFGVDINLFRPVNGFKNDQKKIIGTVKTLSPKYGIDYLIRAFKIVKERNVDANLELHIAGRGEQEMQLKKLCRALKIDKQVKFLGFLNQEKVIETFNSFDISVFPSNSESFGVAAVEAQACGVPVIVSNVGGLPEATKPGFSSLVVESKNEGQLADAIEQLLNNNQLRKDMARNARKFVEENYNINDNFGKVESIYQRILNEN